MTEHQFGARLAELRHRAGLSWAELGRRSGLTPEGVSLIERGKRTNPALSTILALARALDVEPAALLEPARPPVEVEHDQAPAPELVEVGASEIP